MCVCRCQQSPGWDGIRSGDATAAGRNPTGCITPAIAGSPE